MLQNLTHGAFKRIYRTDVLYYVIRIYSVGVHRGLIGDYMII